MKVEDIAEESKFERSNQVVNDETNVKVIKDMNIAEVWEEWTAYIQEVFDELTAKLEEACGGIKLDEVLIKGYKKERRRKQNWWRRSS